MDQWQARKCGIGFVLVAPPIPGVIARVRSAARGACEGLTADRLAAIPADREVVGTQRRPRIITASPASRS
jgi:hypothetical protein